MDEYLKELYHRRKILQARIAELKQQDGNPENPFILGGPIKFTEKFIGRHEEMDTLVTHLQNGNSVSVLGERRIGKSSLLYYFYLTGHNKLYHPSFRYHFLYLDLQSPRMKTPLFFVREILKALNISYDKEEVKEAPMAELTMKLEEFRKNGHHPFVLLDEFEALTKHKALFNDDFIDGLRHLAYHSYLTYVVSSKILLKTLSHKGDLNSSFWGIFSPLPLGEWKVNKTRNEVQEFVENYWLPLQPNHFEREFLSQYAPFHPLKMQVLSHHLLQNRKWWLTADALKKRIEQSLHDSYFAKEAYAQLHETKIITL